MRSKFLISNQIDHQNLHFLNFLDDQNFKLDQAINNHMTLNNFNFNHNYNRSYIPNHILDIVFVNLKYS